MRTAHGPDVAFRAMAEAMPQLVWSASGDGVIDYFNQRWIEYTGVTLERYRSEDRNALGVIHPDELESTWESWNRAIATAQPYEIEHRIKRTSDGTYRWFLERAVPMRDERGRVIRWIGTGTDIDDQRRSRDNLTFVVEAGNVLAAASLNVLDICDALGSVTVDGFADWCIVVLQEQGKANTVAVAHKNKELLHLVREYRDRAAGSPDEELANLLKSRKPYMFERVLPEMLEAAARDADHLAVMKALRMHSLMVVPIVTDNAAYGAMTIASSQSGRLFNETDLAVATAVAGRAGIAIENALAYQRERRTAQRLRFVARVNQLLFESSDVPTTFERVARMIASEIADACAVVRLDGSTVRVEVAVARDPTANGILSDLRAKRMFRPEAENEVARALRRHETILSLETVDTFRDRVWPYLSPQASALAPKATVTVPLYSAPATYGALVAYYSEREYDPARDLELLEEVAARASVALARAETFDRERRIATTLQRASLPSLIPTPEGVRFDTVYLPAGDEAEVGGDWYDAIELDDGSVVVSAGDVTGRGIEAAAIMSKVRHAMGMAPLHESDPSRILDSAEWFLRKRYPEAIVTAFVGIVSPDRKQIRYASAGHPWPYLRREGKLIELQSVGLPLGLRHSCDCGPSRSFDLYDGDLLVLYTDGLVEWNKNVLEGERQLERLLRTEVLLASTAPAKLIARTCLPAHAHDDVAILTVSFGPSPDWSFATEDARAAADARAHFVQFLRSRTGEEDFLARAELVFGELLGNVVRHAPGPVEISLFRANDRWTLHVIDSGTAFDLSEQLPDDLLSERGRGLFIVRRLASELRVEHVFNCGNHLTAVL